ncbi:glycine betaine ABC transporter substrate-binding protein [Isachenkonia alkalipeptolytica]|uniref:glycine betaine ABC transporter substrate-binding protein n=1 Tax=Isachenkonia alkalipeptolytica TaxID=2565777 RepID=UPI001F1CAC4D|nr:glycine betaine ABC transporter substrate-binding protein [Isachenkonia alkalipeptolytica]
MKNSKSKFRPTMKKMFILVLIIGLLSTALIGCGNEEDPVVVASKPHAEQYILGEMLSILIEEHTDIPVERNFGIGGGTSNIHPAMVSGEIDIYPEYTGTSWMFVLNEDLIEDPEELYEATKAAYEEEFELQWLDLYGFNNTYALAIAEDIAEEHDIHTYSDLAAVSGEVTFGAEYDFYERDDGFDALAALYGFDFQREVELDIGLKYQAIDQGEVDVINAFSTDGLLSAYDLRVLEDDQFFFPSYFAGTIIRRETLEAHPELEEVLNRLAGNITDEEMIEMNYRVEEENEDPEAVAREFLEEKGLI